MSHVVTHDSTDGARANKQKPWVWRLPDICRHQTSMVYPFVCTGMNRHETAADVCSYNTNWRCQLNHSRANSLYLHELRCNAGPVAARSKAWVCGRSPTEIVGSNPNGEHGRLSVVSAVCCAGRGLCDELITRPEESYWLWCVWVWLWSLDNEEALAHWGLLPHGKKKVTLDCVSAIGRYWVIRLLWWVDDAENEHSDRAIPQDMLDAGRTDGHSAVDEWWLCWERETNNHHKTRLCRDLTQDLWISFSCRTHLLFKFLSSHIEAVNRWLFGPLFWDITLRQWVMEYRRFEATYGPYHARSRGHSANKQSKRIAWRLLNVYPEDERYNSKRREGPARQPHSPKRHKSSLSSAWRICCDSRTCLAAPQHMLQSFRTFYAVIVGI